MPVNKRLIPVFLGALAWISVLSLIVGSGWIEAKPMPRIMLFFVASNLVSIGVGFSPIGRWLAESVPIAWLVGFQGFRLPLELILHAWAREGTIPMSMTWTGANWDIVSGIVALTAAPWASRARFVAWLANGVGFLLLLNVARVALLSSPVPFAWPVQPPLQLAFHLPSAWIVPICVGGALIGHIALTRALLQSQAASERLNETE